jgi:hypothetical protein
MPRDAPPLDRERQAKGGILLSESQTSHVHGGTTRRHGEFLAHHTNG